MRAVAPGRSQLKTYSGFVVFSPVLTFCMFSEQEEKQEK